MSYLRELFKLLSGLLASVMDADEVPSNLLLGDTLEHFAERAAVVLRARVRAHVGLHHGGALEFQRAARVLAPVDPQRRFGVLLFPFFVDLFVAFEVALVLEPPAAENLCFA